jgi:hypothetical protein
MRTTGKLALEIIRKSVGNTALPEFDLREQES